MKAVAFGIIEYVLLFIVATTTINCNSYLLLLFNRAFKMPYHIASQGTLRDSA